MLLWAAFWGAVAGVVFLILNLIVSAWLSSVVAEKSASEVEVADAGGPGEEERADGLGGNGDAKTLQHERHRGAPLGAADRSGQ